MLPWSADTTHRSVLDFYCNNPKSNGKIPLNFLQMEPGGMPTSRTAHKSCSIMADCIGVVLAGQLLTKAAAHAGFIYMSGFSASACRRSPREKVCAVTS